MTGIIRNGFIAGLLIGVGCVANIVSDNPLQGAILFSLALLAICAIKYKLYTGAIGFLNSFSEIHYLILMLLANFAGVAAFCYLIANYSGLNIDTSALCEAKLNETWYEALTRSFGCGVLIHIAVISYLRVSTPETKANPLFVILPVVAFILCGYDHCIANYGYLVMNNVYWTNNLPIWVAGNSLGALTISKIEF